MQGLSLVAASGGHSSSQCAVLSLSRPLLLRSTGSRRAGSVVVAHGPSLSSPLREGLLQLRQAGATPHRGARAPHYRGPSRCGAQGPDAQAQQLWLTGSSAPRHVGSSQTRARTRVPCTGRQTLNHCATREALNLLHLNKIRNSVPQ